MMKKDILIMALNKMKPMMGVKEHGKEEESQERLLEILKDELGVESSKWGDGDQVEFKVSAKIKEKTPNSFKVGVSRIYIPKEENEKKTINYPVPSVSA